MVRSGPGGLLTITRVHEMKPNIYDKHMDSQRGGRGLLIVKFYVVSAQADIGRNCAGLGQT